MVLKANPYLELAAMLGVTGTEPLLHRVAEWHDTMVAHERARKYEPCDEACPHAEARRLWVEVAARFGRRANQFAFLRSRASQQRKAA